MAALSADIYTCRLTLRPSVYKAPRIPFRENIFSLSVNRNRFRYSGGRKLPMPTKLMLEGDELPYTEYIRLAALFLMQKLSMEPRLSVRHAAPRQPLKSKCSPFGHCTRQSIRPDSLCLSSEMTDRELSIEIERLMRLEGSLGIFRVFGQSMEIFMGSVLTGDNAATPSPYDFALGGEGSILLYPAVSTTLF